MKITMAIMLGLSISLFYGHEETLCSGKVEHSPLRKQHPLFSVMNATDIREMPITPAEAVETSEVIVRGRIVSITEGRSIEHNNGYSHPINTALFKIEVSKVLKGDVGKYVYFEYIRGGLPAEILNERKYTEDILLLLRQPGWNKSAYTLSHSPNGSMHEVDTLYSLTTQRGLLIEEKTGATKKLTQPLNTVAPLFRGSSFNDLEREIPALIAKDAEGF